MVPEKTKRLSFRIPLMVAVAAVGLCALAWLGAGIYLYWNDSKLVNFLAAWIPAVGSFVIAFVPEGQMTPTKKWFWRSSVIAMGFAWSIILWHQQVVNEVSTAKDQERIVSDAVSKANKHSDEQIGTVRQDVQGVKTDLGGLKTDLQQSTSAITSGMGKIGKPEPPKLARLQFSLFKDGMQDTDLPMLRSSISVDKDGIVPIDVTFTNISETPADSLEVWVLVGDICTFTEEPRGSDRPAGMPAYERHFNVAVLNAGVSFQQTTLKVKCPFTPPYPLGLGFKYSCKTCGPMVKIPQQVIVQVTLPLQK